MNTTKQCDVAVIGGGAAGLSAALVLSRAQRRVVVVDSGLPRNAPASHMHGYLSRDGMPPSELLTAGRAEVTRYGGELVDGTVTAAFSCPEGGFDLQLADRRSLHTRRLLIATGLVDELPDIPGLGDRWGRDLLHCPYCHGYEVQGKPLGVLGGTPTAVWLALLIRQWSADVIFFAHSTVLTESDREQLSARAIRIVEGDVTRLVTDNDRLTGVEMADGRLVPRAAVFVGPRLRANNGLLADLGARSDAEGWPIADSTGKTSVSGLWAAGNAANPRAQVITAAGEGSAAAIAINNDLTEEDVEDAVEAFRADLPS